MSEVTAATRFSDVGDEPTRTLPPLEGYEKKELVSLEEAVKSIDPMIHDLDRMVWTAKRNSREPPDNLTPDESAAIRLYTMEWSSDEHDSFYKTLNKKLRSEQRKHLKVWFSYLKLFFTALYKLPSVKKQVWRGIRGNVNDQYQDDYIWWGFSSCTTTVQAIENFIGRTGERTLFMIECIHGKDIKSHSSYKNENEILLMPGTYLKVIGKWSPADSLHIIHLQEENPPHELRRSPFVSTVSPDNRAHVRKWLDPRFHQDEKGEKRAQMMHEFVSEIPDPPSSEVDGILLNHITGALVGLALGDALGAPIQFRTREYLVKNPVRGLSAGGPWGLLKGQFNGNTSMALCLASSLIVCRRFVPYDQLVRYQWWYRFGYMSSTGQCFDIGDATRQALDEFHRRQIAFAREHNIPQDKLDRLSDSSLADDFNVRCGPETAGNGALVRLAPIPLFFFRHPFQAVEYAGLSGQITHGDIKAYDACRFYGALIIAAIRGYDKGELLDEQFHSKHRDWFGDRALDPEILAVAHGSYRRPGGYADGIRGKDYVVPSLEAALWAFWSTSSFVSGALAAVNLGGHTDMTAAIYGQLAGAYYGLSKLPQRWFEELYAADFLRKLAKWILYEGERFSKSSDL